VLKAGRKLTTKSALAFRLTCSSTSRFTHLPSAAPGVESDEKALGRRGDDGSGAPVEVLGVRVSTGEP
jgi:hypothetical protein